MRDFLCRQGWKINGANGRDVAEATELGTQRSVLRGNVANVDTDKLWLQMQYIY